MSDKLKPCPFCGQVPHTFGYTDSTKWGAVFCCIKGPEVRTGYMDISKWKDEAAKAWNTRASLKSGGK